MSTCALPLRRPHAPVVEGHDERRAPRVGREHRRAPLEAADGREHVRRPTRARADARTDVVVAADDTALEDVALGEEVDPAPTVQLGELGPELADAANAKAVKAAERASIEDQLFFVSLVGILTNFFGVMSARTRAGDAICIHSALGK